MVALHVHWKLWLILALLMSLTFPATLQSQQNLLIEFKSELQKARSSPILREFKVTVNPELSISTERMAIAPIRENWSDLLKKNGQSILGVVYTRIGLKRLQIPKGFFAVLAKGTINEATWFLLGPDGSIIGNPIKATATPLKTFVDVPRVLLEVKSPDRGCFEDDSIRQCGDFD